MPSSPFAEFARTAEAVAATTSKLRKRDLLAAYLRDLPPDDLAIAATFFAGRPLPGAADKLGLGWVQQSQALSAATGADEQALSAAYLRHSDFGDHTFHFSEESDLSSSGPIFSDHSKLSLESDQVTVRVNLMVSRFFFGH